MSYLPFKEEFFDRFVVYLGDVFHYDVISNSIDSISSYLQGEMDLHINKWKDYMSRNTMDKWWQGIDHMKNWCYERNNYAYEQLDTYLGRSGLTEVSVNLPEDLINDFSVSINDIPLSRPDFSDKYFRGKEVEVSAKSKKSDIGVLGWKIKSDKENGTEAMEISGKRVTYLIPSDCKEVVFELLSGPTDYQAGSVEDIIIYSDR